ncbi:hypothetical protein CSV75_15930 [Sporosarcina sp. P18a]|uniref:hypothetical protein n=1 Tax=Bacillales TaxID=1385 RepID=UPI000C16C77E|nr:MULTISPECIES: hypothetical protein [Bacillales]PIC78631.1 hypothetical protein CSV75_15930 [Sporosarcina sp. P18a]PLS14580.1 hypothetical protein CVD28_27430 [Bacillus sp. M6-12]
MLNDLFYGMRDVKHEYKEAGVTATMTGEAIHLLTARQCNVRVDVEGMTGNATLSIKFEESNDGITFNEIGTFPIPDQHHGVLFAKFKEYVRYQLLVSGTDPNMDISIKF